MATDPWKDGRIPGLLRELQQAGSTPLCFVRNGVLRAHGETLSIDAAHYSDAELNAVLQLAVANATLSITLQLAEDRAESLALFREFCQRLRSLLLDNAVSAGAVSLQLDAAQISPQAAWLVRRELLAVGPVTFTVGSHTDRSAWLQLWHHRTTPEIGTVVHAEASSPCPLLASEIANTTLPELAIAAPAGSAWLPLRVDLRRVCNTRGDIHRAALQRALIASVQLGNALLDEAFWHGSRARHDAWFNRRLAIELEGIAAVASLRGREPGSFACLQDLAALLGEVCAELHSASQAMAKQFGALPALRQQERSVKAARGGCSDDWRMRWQRTLQNVAVRNRALLLINPWDLISPAKKAEFGHLDLLPLAAAADAVCFRRKVAISHWNINEFKEFHLRLGAVLRHKYRALEFAQPV